MTSPDIDTVLEVARLARLEVSAAEAERLAGQFARILEAFHSLSELPVDDVEPMTGATELSDVTAPDLERPPFDTERLLARAPARVEDFFEVPKTVGGAPAPRGRAAG